MTISTDYKIIGFNANRGQILVKFDVLPHTIPLDLHLTPEGLYPEGDVLDRYIRGVCPTAHVQRHETISKGVLNADVIASLVQELPSDPVDESKRLEPEIDINELAEIRMVVAIQRTLTTMAGATV
jgi:hypothetical protein